MDSQTLELEIADVEEQQFKGLKGLIAALKWGSKKITFLNLANTPSKPWYLTRIPVPYSRETSEITEEIRGFLEEGKRVTITAKKKVALPGLVVPKFPDTFWGSKETLPYTPSVYGYDGTIKVEDSPSYRVVFSSFSSQSDVLDCVLLQRSADTRKGN